MPFYRNSRMSFNDESLTVILLAAGMGTRMGPFAEITNKALLPVDKKAIISHIIEQFPLSTNFVVATGHEWDGVQDYLGLVYPDRNMCCIRVDNYSTAKAGPAVSLAACKKVVGKKRPFFVIACDALYDLKDFPTDDNYVGVSAVNPDESTAYCNVIEEDGTVVEIIDKKYSDSGLAFNGVFYIKDTAIFWNSLNKDSRELSSGWKDLKMKTHRCEWTDLGTYGKYTSYVQKDGYDFSKPAEFFYDVNGKIYKKFLDENALSVSMGREVRYKFLKSVFPKLEFGGQHGIVYDKVPGEVLYKAEADDVRKFFSWCEKKLWKRNGEDGREIPRLNANHTDQFYFEKTMKRLDDFEQKYPDFRPKSINGRITTQDFRTALSSKIDWEGILKKDFKERSYFMHGDLQFDNVIYDGEKFTLIDWREGMRSDFEEIGIWANRNPGEASERIFFNEILYSDKWYDIAKMVGGMLLNYDLIKEGRFTFEDNDGDIIFSYDQHDMFKDGKLIEELMANYPEKQINDIVTLIYLNMAPLHHAPFDKLLYCLAYERLLGN
jgi:choline kinase